LKNLPSQEDTELARESSRALSSAITTSANTQQIDLHDDKGRLHTLQITATALRLLIDVLTEIGKGNAVSIVAIHAELTTQEAADLLNISRPFLVQLLHKGELQFHKIGTHHRLHYRDVLDYKKRIEAERRKAQQPRTRTARTA
jgi:excisionase family DNA binding protein